MDVNGISIIICCHNSRNRIEPTLSHVFNVVVPEGLFCEVILIDNNSSDDTAAFANHLEATYNHQGLPFTIQFEPRPGLSRARETGLVLTKNDVVVFCDDDNHLATDYLIVLAEILQKNPGIGIVGGLARPGFPYKEGDWIEDFFPAMAVGPQAPYEGITSWVYGAGMAIKREVFEKIRLNNMVIQLSDRSGNKLLSGGDAELCLLARVVGFKIYYSPRMVLHHAIASHRLRKGHYLKAKMSTIGPSVYLYFLEGIMSDSSNSAAALYFKRWRTTLHNLAYFLPRVFIGMHRFYSFFMFYRSLQESVWLLLNWNTCTKKYTIIVENLSLKNGSIGGDTGTH